MPCCVYLGQATHWVSVLAFHFEIRSLCLLLNTLGCWPASIYRVSCLCHLLDDALQSQRHATMLGYSGSGEYIVPVLAQQLFYSLSHLHRPTQILPLSQLLVLASGFCFAFLSAIADTWPLQSPS